MMSVALLAQRKVQLNTLLDSDAKTQAKVDSIFTLLEEWKGQHASYLSVKLSAGESIYTFLGQRVLQDQAPPYQAGFGGEGKGYHAAMELYGKLETTEPDIKHKLLAQVHYDAATTNVKTSEAFAGFFEKCQVDGIEFYSLNAKLRNRAAPNNPRAKQHYHFRQTKLLGVLARIAIDQLAALNGKSEEAQAHLWATTLQHALTLANRPYLYKMVGELLIAKDLNALSNAPVILNHSTASLQRVSVDASVQQSTLVETITHAASLNGNDPIAQRLCAVVALPKTRVNVLNEFKQGLIQGYQQVDEAVPEHINQLQAPKIIPSVALATPVADGNNYSQPLIQLDVADSLSAQDAQKLRVPGWEVEAYTVPSQYRNRALPTDLQTAFIDNIKRFSIRIISQSV